MSIAVWKPLQWYFLLRAASLVLKHTPSSWVVHGTPVFCLEDFFFSAPGALHSFLWCKSEWKVEWFVFMLQLTSDHRIWCEGTELLSLKWRCLLPYIGQLCFMLVRWTENYVVLPQTFATAERLEIVWDLVQRYFFLQQVNWLESLDHSSTKVMFANMSLTKETVKQV